MYFNIRIVIGILLAVALVLMYTYSRYFLISMDTVRTAEQETLEINSCKYSTRQASLVEAQKFYYPDWRLSSLDSNTTNLGPTLLVLADFRTGSTLVASLFQEFPGAFYVFEPLHGLNNRVTYFNGTTISVDSTNRQQVHDEEVHKVLTCNLENLPLNTILDHARTGINDSLNPLKTCIFAELKQLMILRQSPLANITNRSRYLHTFFDHVNCIKARFCVCKNHLQEMRKKCLAMSKVTEHCIRAPLKVTKYIRLGIKSTELLLKRFPLLKIVLVLRDPRGTGLSQRIEFSNSTVPELASLYCDWVRTQISEKKKLSETFPNKLFTIQYDSLAEDPINMTQKLYSFAGLPFVDQVRNSVWKNTQSGEHTECEYCVDRGNSSKAAHAWKKKISKEDYIDINSDCMDIIAFLGLDTNPFWPLANASSSTVS